MPLWHKAIMDLRHARTFVTVAELGSVSKAALRLHIAQPALSRQIGNLEQSCGLRLLQRRFPGTSLPFAQIVQAAAVPDLDRWLDRILDATTIADVFAD